MSDERGYRRAEELVDATVLEALKKVTAWAKEERIQRFAWGDLVIEFAPDAFRPPAPERPQMTEDERKKLEKRAQERKTYGSSVG